MSEIQLSQMNEEVITQHPGFLKRILWTITSPGKLMASLAEKPRILFAMLITALPMDILYLARMPLYKDFLRASTAASSEYVESLTGTALTAEQIENSLPTAMIQGMITTPIMALLMWVIISAILFGVLKLMGGQGKFKAYLSVAGYSGVISALYVLIVLVVSGFTGSLHLDPTLTSLATLVTKDSVSVVLYNILKSLDIFSIWYYVVMAIGLAAVSKVKKQYVYLVVAVLFLIGLIINVAGALAVSSIM